jgi:hypothetical protein
VSLPKYPRLKSILFLPYISFLIRGYIIWFFIRKKDLNRMLICQIKLATVLEQQITKSLFLKFAYKRGADKTVMAGDEDFGSVLHMIPSKGAVFEKSTG